MNRLKNRKTLFVLSCLAVLPLFVWNAIHQEEEKPMPPSPEAIALARGSGLEADPAQNDGGVRRKALRFDQGQGSTDPWPECYAVRATLGTLIGYHEVATWDERTPDGLITVTVRTLDRPEEQWRVPIGSRIDARRPERVSAKERTAKEKEALKIAAEWALQSSVPLPPE